MLDLMAQHPAWSLPLGCKDGVFELAGVPSGAHLRDLEMFRFFVDGSRDFDDLQFQERVGHGRRWRARTLMLALCRLENQSFSGMNFQTLPRFGTEEPSAPRIEAIYGQNVGAWLSLVERPVRDRKVAGSNPVAPISSEG